LYAVLFVTLSSGLLLVIDSARKASDERILEEIVKEARKRAQKRNIKED